MIVSHLRQLALKQLRLTCQNLKSIAEPPLFHTLYGRSTDDTVNMFLNVARSGLRSLVREFVWDNRAVCLKAQDDRKANLQDADRYQLDLQEVDPRLDALITDEDRLTVKCRMAEQVSSSKRLCEWGAFRGPAAVFFESLKRKIPFRIEVPDRVDELLQYPIKHLRDTAVLFSYATWATAGMITTSLKPSYPLSEDGSAYPFCAAFEAAWWVHGLEKIVVIDTFQHWSNFCEKFPFPSRLFPYFDDWGANLELYLTFDTSEDVDEQFAFEAEGLASCMDCRAFTLCMRRDSSMQSTMNEQKPYFKRPLTMSVDSAHFHRLLYLAGCTLQWREWKEGLQKSLDLGGILKIRIKDCRVIGLLKEPLLRMRFCLCDTEEFEGQDKSNWGGDPSSISFENVEDDEGESIWAWYDCKGEGFGCILSGSQEQYQQYLSTPPRESHKYYYGFRRWLAEGVR